MPDPAPAPRPSTLWAALALDTAAPPVVAIVGGGGKTALLYRLGREAVVKGRRAVIGGTTRFTPAPPAQMPTVVTADDAALAAAVGEALEDRAIVVASAGDRAEGRFGPMSPETAGRIAALRGVGLLALEADGSKMLPFKAPADHEPVIPPAATHVVAVVGLDALDAPLDAEHVHRPERVRALISSGTERVRALVGSDAPATCDATLIARVLADARGGRKDVGDRRFAVLVNKADLDEARALALGAAVRAAGVERVVVASLRDASPVRALLL
jgi:molybdenum cofactor cytidylyltransferase